MLHPCHLHSIWDNCPIPLPVYLVWLLTGVLRGARREQQAIYLSEAQGGLRWRPTGKLWPCSPQQGGETGRPWKRTGTECSSLHLKAFVVAVLKARKFPVWCSLFRVYHRPVTAQDVLRGGGGVMGVSSAVSQEWKDTRTPTLCLWGAQSEWMVVQPSLFTATPLGTLPRDEAFPELFCFVDLLAPCPFQATLQK